MKLEELTFEEKIAIEGGSVSEFTAGLLSGIGYCAHAVWDGLSTWCGSATDGGYAYAKCG